MNILIRIKKIFFEILPPTIFFFISFSLILVTKRLMVSRYGIPWTGFGEAVVGAFLIGKVVLVVDKLPFVNRYPERPLIYNTLWKTIIYFLAAFFLHYLTQIAPLLVKHKSLMEASRHLISIVVWPRFWLIQIWLTVLLLVYCAMRELIRVVGRDKFIQMFFGNPKEMIR